MTPSYQKNKFLHFLQIAELLKTKKLKAILAYLRKYSFISSILFFSIGMIFIIFKAPNDHLQGQVAKIMYIHVPASWGALALYSVMGFFNILGFIKRIPQCFIISKSIAPTGLAFCFISLITGSLWGKPTWGTYWVWDARLTSMLILSFLYIGYILSTQTYETSKLTLGAYISVLGLLNIPVIKGSVDWWFTLHQPASIQLLKLKSTIDPIMLFGLMIMSFAFAFFASAMCSSKILYNLRFFKSK